MKDVELVWVGGLGCLANNFPLVRTTIAPWRQGLEDDVPFPWDILVPWKVYNFNSVTGRDTIYMCLKPASVDATTDNEQGSGFIHTGSTTPKKDKLSRTMSTWKIPQSNYRGRILLHLLSHHGRFHIFHNPYNQGVV